MTVVAVSPRRAGIGPLARLPLASMFPLKIRGFAIGVTVFVLPRTNAWGVFDTSRAPACEHVRALDRIPQSVRDSAGPDLGEIRDPDVARLVIGLKRRSPVGHAPPGSVSGRLLSESPVPVAAMQLREEEDS